MRAALLVRIVGAIAITVLFLGPAMSFAMPMAAIAQEAPGKVSMVLGATQKAMPCADCPMPNKAKATGGGPCASLTCPAALALPELPASIDRQVHSDWMMLPLPVHAGIAARVDSPPPKPFSHT